MSQTVLLLEYVVAGSSSLEVDAEGGIVKGVRVLGLESANGRSYLREGIKAAIGLYEGKAVNTDHPSRAGEATPLSRRLGWLEQVRQDSDGGLRANLHLLKSHPYAAAVLEAASVRPQLMGLSHNASGKTRRENGREIVESIEAVHSVDLVADPASVSGLHEGMKVEITVKQLIEACACKRPGYAKALKEMAEAGLMSPDTTMEPPPEVSDPLPSEGADHEQAIYDAAKACIDDPALDVAGKLAKIRKLLGLVGKGSEKEEVADAKAEEGKAAMAGLLLENKSLKMLAARGLKLTPLGERALASCKNEADVEATVKLLEESAQGAGHGGPQNGSQKPRSSTPGVSQQSVSGGHGGQGGQTKLTEDKVPEDIKAAGKWLTA